MDNLEKYIQDNLGQFNTGELPQGHQERFLAKLARSRRRPLRWGWAAAAAVIAAVLATGIQFGNERQLEISVEDFAQEMYLEEAGLLQMFQEEDQYMINNIKAITEEAIPLAEQLPNELSPEKRAKILREYYKAKTAALKQMKTLYAQSEQPID